MEFGQLPAQAHRAIRPETGCQILQRGGELVGGFVENHGPPLLGQGFQMLPAAFFGGGEKTLKAEPPGGLPGDAQGGDGGAGTGDGAHRDSRLGALFDQIFSRVGNGGAACVGNQGAGLAVQNPLDDLVSFEGLVMLVVADKAFFDAQMIQQFQGDPGILGGDEVRLFQGFPAPDGDVPQIADGGGNEIEHSGHYETSFL